MSARLERGAQTPPVVDEWGIYDPARAGLAAVMDRLEAKTAAPPSPSGSRIAVAIVRDTERGTK